VTLNQELQVLKAVPGAWSLLGGGRSPGHLEAFSVDYSCIKSVTVPLSTQPHCDARLTPTPTPL